jgi:AraC-like DNA-binding protein
LIEVALEQTSDPALGLHWGERSPLTNYGIVSSVAQWSPSPGQALETLTRFQGLLFQGRPVAAFQVHGQVATLRFEPNWLSRTARRIWTEFSVVGSCVLVQTLCGRGVTRARATFQHAAPSYRHEYGRILGSEVAFERSTCALELDVAQLDLAAPHYNPRLNEAVLFEANCALGRLGNERRCSARVREQLASESLNAPTMDGIARKLGMSSRTLRRHLEQEGTAFQALVEEALCSRALRLLGDPQSSVKEVAYALGFTTPSGFHRAFKRWTGSSPAEVRAGRAALGRSQTS